MNVYTDAELQQNLTSVLDKVVEEGEVQIWRNDGRLFVIRSIPVAQSPLDVTGLDWGLTTAEILAAIQEGRQRLPFGNEEKE